MLLSQNLRYLRKERNLTQQELADRLGLKRGIIGAYEEGRAEPRILTLQHMAVFFEVSLDSLLFVDLSTGKPPNDFSGSLLRILPVIIDSDTGVEKATLVPVKATAGYLQGYGDMEYVEALPSFAMPFPELPKDRTYRLFQIGGDSMLPIPSGAYVVGEYVSDWNAIRFGERYVLLTKSEGIVFKRVYALPSGEGYELVSENQAYKPYRIGKEEILEVWKIRGMISFDLDAIGSAQVSDFRRISDALVRIEKRLST